jgi:DNA segregation ATPase FtsK/SpoIIIE, S-DNA-T family
MATNRKVPYDIFVVFLLATVVFLIASVATYDTADNMVRFPSWLTAIYQPDQLVFPGHAVVDNACGIVGAWTADFLVHALGFGAYYLLFGLVALQISLFRNQSLNQPWFRGIGWALSLVGISTLCGFLVPGEFSSVPIGAGGLLGSLTQRFLSEHMALTGGMLVSVVVTLIGLMMWTDYLIFRAGKMVVSPALVAASAVLPFGLLNRLFLWINRDQSANAESAEPARDFTTGSDLPRTIRVKGSDGEAAEISYDSRTAVELPKPKTASDKGTAGVPSVAPVVAPPKATPSPKVVEIAAVENEADQEEEIEFDDEEILEEDETESSVHAKPHFSLHTDRPKKVASERDVVIQQLNDAADKDSGKDYALPTIELLQNGTIACFDDQKREALQKAEMLEKTCKEFGYNVRVVEIETGPVISQYEIQLEAGLRLQKITALADDLAIALRVPSVRIVAPIPGKNTVGVEVPNETRELVRLREVIEQSTERTKKMKIPLFLGKDAVGSPMVVDLASLPHLLIAGRTGTGKSVCLNAIITSILMTRRPDEVRMLMIDPKMVELSGYGRLPHLMHPVVTDMRKAEAILAWAVDKMEERYKLLAQVGVRHITSFNQLGEDEIMDRLQPEDEEARKSIPTHLPFIVIVADEMADLMMTSGKEVEQHIIRLAQKSRAVGIHLILATQKPTVDVITGLIKSNLPARIAFQVASKVDSRVVLDAMGADKLLGNGDMLFLWPGTSNLLRGQGTYLSDEEIERVTEAVSTTEQNFVHELMHIKVTKEGEEAGETPGKLPNRDDLYEDAIEIVIREGRGSVSLLQRALRIGYGRAARLIDFMEEDGVVGAYNGSNARDVIMTLSQWEAMRNGNSDTPEAEPKNEIQTNSSTRQTKLAASQLKQSPLRPAKKPKPPVIIAAEEDDDAAEELDDEDGKINNDIETDYDDGLEYEDYVDE